MLFNSIDFAIFYVIVTIGYFLLPGKFRWVLLLGASMYFYMAFVPIYILILGFTIVIDYIAGIVIENATGAKRKWFLIMSLVANIGVLAVFKYYNFINNNITDLLHMVNVQNQLPYLKILLPIGLSFHTFQAMSYTIEVYRGNHKAEKHFGIYSLYVMFYPQLVAGPIERPQNILYQMHRTHKFSFDNLKSGLGLMLWGLFKKIVIADRLSIYVSSVYVHPEVHNGTTVLLASFVFAIQIYCDFSGYSDIAIGAARTMGYDLMINFRRPYFATSIRDFWSRWHISLSTWFRDYLYIPLGGNRVSKARGALNLFLVFLISGLWHGANFTFIIWGALHGAYLVIGNFLRPYFPTITSTSPVIKFIVNTFNVGVTILLVTFAWIFFRADNMHVVGVLLNDLKTFGERPYLGDNVSNFGYCVIAMAILFIAEYKAEKLPDRFRFYSSQYAVVRWATVMALIFCIILFGVVNGSQFIYFQF
jgi:alginate O-acetyltransferase complex protein AlgI